MMIPSTISAVTLWPRACVQLLAALGIALLATTADASDKLAVKAGRVMTVSGEDIANGVVVIEGGKITAVGAAGAVAVPWDAEVIDEPELTAFPGFVEAHTNNGMDRANESIDVAPFLDIRDSIDPVNFYFEDMLRSGVTTIGVGQGNACVIGGMGMVVKPRGLTVEEMLVHPKAGLKMSVAPKSGKSRATQNQDLRRAFDDLRRYLEELVQEKKDGDDTARREALYQGRDLEGERGKGRAMGGIAWKVDGLELVPRGEIDEKQEPLLDVVEGNVPVWIYCGAPMDVPIALDLARENGFLPELRLVLDNSCWKAADMIAQAGVPVVLDENLMHIERDPVTGEEIETFVPGVFHDKGVTFALSSANSTTESLWFQAAMCIAYGMDRKAALAAVTTAPAELLGVEKRVGDLAVGMDGNVLLFSGDPLSVTSFVEKVIIEGELAYDRSTDVRAKYLLEGVAPANTASSAEIEAGEHEHGDDGGGGEGDDDDHGKGDGDQGEGKGE